MNEVAKEIKQANIIDGKAFAADLKKKIAIDVAKLKAITGKIPGLAVILIGDDPASSVYVRNKGKSTKAAGMESFEFHMSEDTTESDLLAKIDDLNNNDKIHGILVQLPLPSHINEEKVINSISPEKDVDGFHILNSGKLATGQKCMIPCTPLGCMKMLKSVVGDLSGLNALIIGRSNIVGKPMASLLLAENCTVTIAHSRTKNIPELCRNSDIIVAAVGRPKMVKGDWIKQDAVVIDVGINRVKIDGKNKLVGDVDFAAAQQFAGAITPVPGGVGPMTIACLLSNTVDAFCNIHNVEL